MSEQTIIVSGGSRGLGASLVETLLADGHRVATFSRKPSETIERLLASDGVKERFSWAPVDSTDTNAIRSFVRATAKRFGSVDALVNNAAVGIDGVLTLMREDDIRRGLDVNLNSVILLTQACAKLMLAKGAGTIVNVTSVNGIRGYSGVSVYSAAKAAIDGFTRSLARELGPRGIRVNSVAPGYFESDMVEALTAQQKARIARRTPLGRLANAEDVSGVVRFMLSDAARFVTGQILAVDGGITC